MDLQDIREQMQLSEELFTYFKAALFPDGIKYCNPDFLVCDEERARAGKVFDDSDVAFPTQSACIAANVTAVRQIKEQEIRIKYAELMEKVAKPYLPAERETWFKQQEGAEKYSADGTITVFIQNMADSRGISVGELIAKIEENITEYDVAIATLLGLQQKEIDLLNV